MCSDQSPWAVNDNLAYGFAAVTASNPTCCQCYKLTFTSTAIKGKTMIVQATNTGTDVSSAQFDLAMPGGGFGMFDACTKEWNATPAVWGDQYGGMHSNQCSKIPEPVQPGCNFRWNWMQGADNPTVDYETVDCPAEIVAKTGCSITGSKASTPIVPSSIQDSTPSGTSSVIVNPGPTSAAEVPVSNISNREPTAPTSVSMSTSEPAQGTGGAGEGEEDDDTCVS
ncbi:MAG: hypothetical protein LQ342_005076 [Letrouitia transgressa]|nr:MAG: hypothetical protein LQ342_005076 [Letrouitia transgressa]